MTQEQKPFDNCYWLVPGKILAGEVPIASNPQYTDLKIESLLDAGIRCFIDLRQERNLEYESVLQNVAVKKKIDIQYFRFPILDMDIPSVEVMKEILDVIDDHIEQGNPVYYHCMAGLGRTGVVSGCWLKRHNNIDGKTVLEMLEEIRLDQNHLVNWESPQTKEQVQMVLEWKYGH